MSCLPMTPEGHYITKASGTFSAVSTSALVQYYPIKDSVITLSNIAQGTNQPVEILSVRVRETATAGNQKLKGLILYFYTDAAPTTPTLAAVYDAPTSNHVATCIVGSGDYTLRLRSGADEVWDAIVQPSRDADVCTPFFVTGTTATATNLYCVALANEAVTYVGTTDITVEVIARVHYGSTTLA